MGTQFPYGNSGHQRVKSVFTGYMLCSPATHIISTLNGICDILGMAAVIK